MSQIRVIYAAEPGFSATDQHPDAVRYKVGAWWVDAIGGEPTLADISAAFPALGANAPILAQIAALEAKLDSKRLLREALLDDPSVDRRTGLTARQTVAGINEQIAALRGQFQ